MAIPHPLDPLEQVSYASNCVSISQENTDNRNDCVCRIVNRHDKRSSPVMTMKPRETMTTAASDVILDVPICVEKKKHVFVKMLQNQW